jgi:hypothetical protein
VSIRRASGFLEQLEVGSAAFKNDVAKLMSRKLELALCSLRAPLVASNHHMVTLYDVPTTLILEQFSVIPSNICVIGSRRFTIVYGYTSGKATGSTGKVVGAVSLISELHEFIRLHATAGATVAVIHHSHGYLGAVKKAASAAFVPVEKVTKRPMVKLPKLLSTTSYEGPHNLTELKGWPKVKAALIRIMDEDKFEQCTKQRRRPKGRRWTPMRRFQR